MSKKRKVCVVTTSRADYWLLKSLIALIHRSDDLELQLFVAGSHLLAEHGYTIKLIEKDNLPISAKIDTFLHTETFSGMSKTIGMTIISFTDYYTMFQPDIVVVLGDRFETLGAVLAAYSLKIPVAHLHGGEISFGALDDNFRHSTTKLSTLHFVSHESYAKRVRQLGEDPKNIFMVGAFCLDQIQQMQKLSRTQLLESLHFSSDDRYVLFCYHPVTAGGEDTSACAANMLEILLSETDYKILITKANVDPAGDILNKLYQEYYDKYSDRIEIYGTLGGDLYYNAVNYCEFFIGNSSSGIIEIPYFSKATINVGRRQEGRESSSATWHSGTTYDELKVAIEMVQKKEWLKENVENAQPVYGKIGTIAKKAYDVIAGFDLKNLSYKKFMDIEHG